MAEVYLSGQNEYGRYEDIGGSILFNLREIRKAMETRNEIQILDRLYENGALLKSNYIDELEKLRK